MAQSKPVELTAEEKLAQQKRWAANADKIVGKTWADVAREFEAEMDAQRPVSEHGKKGGRR